MPESSKQRVASGDTLITSLFLDTGHSLAGMTGRRGQI